MGPGPVSGAGAAYAPLAIALARRRYATCIVTGGIGSGLFFALDGNTTLGREESRSGRLLERRDYCKGHIIAHTVQTLVGGDFPVVPIGLVGDDDVGRRLLEEMAAAGLNVQHVGVLPGHSTLYSICLLYPDGSGGNLTTNDSASAHLTAAHVEAARPTFTAHTGRGIAVAAPEVPLAARRALLALASAHGFLRCAAFTSDELEEAVDTGMLEAVDLLALNSDEAARLAGVSPELAAPRIVEAAVAWLALRYPALQVSITAGSRGSWVWDGRALDHQPALEVAAVGTAGAGDAHLGGLLTGLIAGLGLAEAHQLAALVGAVKVTSPHTIHPGLDRRALAQLAERFPGRVGADVAALLAP